MNPDLDLVLVHLACTRGDAYANLKDEFENKFVREVEKLFQ